MKRFQSAPVHRSFHRPPHSITPGMGSLTRILVVCMLLLQSSHAAEDRSAVQVFDQRILPIFRSPNPSSCVQCHLASVDLKQYILPSHEATFASLRDQGLVDLDHPEQSKILELIRMGMGDPDEGARLIHAKTRQAELEAFTAWIVASSNDPRLRALPKSADLARPPVPDAVIRHARRSRVTDSFVRHVWSQRMRCFPCHTPHEISPINPRHAAARKTQRELVAQYDAATLECLQLFRETPEATLQSWIQLSQSTSADRLPLINLEDPTRSLILLKPMSKLPHKNEDGTFDPPSHRDPVSHMGGLKLHRNDQSYKSMVAWLQDYARVVQGEYTSVDALPQDNWQGTQSFIRIRGTPEAWGEGTAVQMFVHGWDQASEAWDTDPVAFTQGTVTPRKMVNGSLFLLGGGETEGKSEPSAESPQLSRGRYLVKVYWDRTGKIDDDPTAMLGPQDFHGQTVLPRARWRSSFRQAEVIDGKSLENP